MRGLCEILEFSSAPWRGIWAPLSPHEDSKNLPRDPCGAYVKSSNSRAPPGGAYGPLLALMRPHEGLCEILEFSSAPWRGIWAPLSPHEDSKNLPRAPCGAYVKSSNSRAPPGGAYGPL